MQHRYRNPRGKNGATGLGRVLPWLAIGGLLYLMAQNAGKVRAASPGASSQPCAGSVGNNGGANDFGVCGCWCG